MVLNRVKNVIVCGTPWQIMEAINIVVNNVEECKGQMDMFMLANFDNAKELLSKLKSEEIFNHIFFCPKLDLNKEPSTIVKLKRLFFPRCGFKDYNVDYKYIRENYYEKIFITSDCLIGRAIKSENKNGIVYLYDDGVGTYVGNILTSNKSKVYEAIVKRFCIGPYLYQIKKVYVNCKMLCKNLISNNVEELPKLKPESKTVQIAKRVFQFSGDSMLPAYRFIILEQPLERTKGYNGNSLEILYKGQDSELFLVRKHPRKKLSIKEEVKNDTTNNMWELECIFNVSEEHVLIAHCSTAQLTPKTVAGKEPYIIFAYYLFFEKDSKEVEQCEEMVRSFTEIYKRKDKIFVPRNLEEYDKLIWSLIKKDI